MAKAGKGYKKIMVSAYADAMTFDVDGFPTGVVDGKWACVKGMSDASLDRTGDSIDITHFCSKSGFKQYIQGLKEFSISMSGSYEPANDAQGLLDYAAESNLQNAPGNPTNPLVPVAPLSNNEIFIMYLIQDDTLGQYSGWAARFTVENFNQSGAVADKENVDITVKLAEDKEGYLNIPLRVSGKVLTALEI